MTKDQLIKILKSLLNTEEDVDFLLELKKEELEKLVAVVRERVQ